MPLYADGKQTPYSIDVVVPVCNQVEITHAFLDSVLKNTIIPQNIIVVNNGSTDGTSDLLRRFSDVLPLSIVSLPKNTGVNSAWNIGIERSRAELISVLNNDIVLNTKFFSRILTCFDLFPQCGVAVPATVRAMATPADLEGPDTQSCRTLEVREGWAFTIRSVITTKAGPIPRLFHTFFGDDFLFTAARQQGFTWLKMTNNLVFHHFHATIKTLPHASEFLAEQRVWDAYLKSYYHPSALPMHEDMLPYSHFYRKAVQNACYACDDRALLVELGVRHGCSARIITNAIPTGKKYAFYLIDKITSPFLEEFEFNDSIQVLVDDATDTVTLFEDNTVHFLHIDLNPHTYEQTKLIFNLYAPKVRVGGIVVFHDCTEFFGVKQFVNELEADSSWKIEYAVPVPSAQISTPARATRVK